MLYVTNLCHLAGGIYSVKNTVVFKMLLVEFDGLSMAHERASESVSTIDMNFCSYHHYMLWVN